MSSLSHSQGRVKTCENCVRAKIRCSRASTAQSCDRCLRLHKDCYFRPIKTRNPKKRETRIGLLEDKVDQILGQISHGSLASPQKTPQSPTSEIDNPPTSIRHPCDVIGKGLISHDEANRLLERFHDTTTCFPYVQLPREATTEDLRSEKPFLLLSILLVCSFQDVPLHLALEEVSTSYVGSSVLQGDIQQPLDILQGLLLTIAGTKKKNHLMRLSPYLHLANGILRDGRMDVPTKLRVVKHTIDIMDEDEPASNPMTTGTQNEEMRALVGYFLLDACHSVLSQRPGTMPWSPYIESCAAKLSQECEFPTDQNLFGQVRLQHMLEKIQSLVRRGFGEIQATPVEIEAMIHSLQNEAQLCKAQLPATTGRDVTIGIQSHAFEIHLHQTTFFDVFPSAILSLDQSASLLRIDALCHGLAAAKQFMSFYSTLQPGIEKSFSYTQWTSTGFCVAASCKLTLASLEPSLRYHEQVKGLREALNMRSVLQKFSRRMNTLDKECKGGKWDQHEIFFYQEWLQHLSNWFEGQYRLAQSDIAGENNNGIVFDTIGVSDSNIYGEPDSSFPWLDLQDVTIEEMLQAWVGPWPMGMSNYP